MSLESFPAEAAKQVLQSAENILTPSPQKPNEGLMSFVGRSAGESVWKATIEEPVRLVSATIGGISRWTLGAIASVMGWTGRKGLDALMSMPIIPAPAPR